MMKNFRTILFLFISLLLLGCQAKQGESDGDLISRHLPSTNSFTLSPLATKTYVAGETVSFTVNFPFEMTVSGGSPRLRITVGAATRYATFAAQTDKRKLVFNYTFAGAENDTNGIDVNALELNGSTITFVKDGVPVNCDVTTLATQNIPQVNVDTTQPTITGFKLLNLPGMYNENDVLQFRMTFSETVVVTGTPKFIITFPTGGAVDVVYTAGTGSNVLIFSYVVGPSVATSTGLNSITSPIVNGTIKDTVGNNSSLNFSAFTAAELLYSDLVFVSGIYPYIVATDFPENKVYVASDVLEFVLEFNKPVTVTGAPYLNIDVNGVTKQAVYSSGSTTKFLTFTYTALPGDVDPNGITLTNSIQRAAGEDIVITASPSVSFFGNATNNFIPLPDTSGIILNAIQPQAIAVNAIDVTAPTWNGPAVDNVWIIGQQFEISVTFNTAVFVDQTLGVPSIPITIGTTTKQATYVAGGNGQTVLVFRYTVIEGDLDMDGQIALGNIALNGGNIVDSKNTNILLTLPLPSLAKRIDGVKPTILSVTAPTSEVYSSIASYTAANMEFTVTWSEPVNYGTGQAFINMDVNGSTVELSRAGTAGNNDKSSIVHRPGSLPVNTEDTDGVQISSPLSGTAVIKDQAGNIANVFTFTPPVTTGVKVDTKAPTVLSVSAVNLNDTYNAPDIIDFTVTFSEAVTPTVIGDYPRIEMTVGSTTKYLKPVTTGPSLTHTFRYTIASGDLDIDGIAIANVILSDANGYMRDVGRNGLGNTSNAFTLPITSGIKVDAVAPSQPTATTAIAQTYANNEKIRVTVTYDEIVHVNIVGGVPYIPFDFSINDTDMDNLPYIGGTGTDTLIFERQLDRGHFDMDGLPSTVGSINLNGATIIDEGDNNAPTTFQSALDFSSRYVTYPEVKIWAKSDFVNLAPAGAATISNSGTLETRACSSGLGVCRIFDGNGDVLRLDSPISNVSAIFMAIETPAVTGDRNLFTPAVILDRSMGSFDIRTTFNSTVMMDNTTYSGSANSTYHQTNLGNSVSRIFQLVYQTTHSFNPGNLIDDTYLGAIGEVIVIDGTISSGERDTIRNYLNARY